MYNQAQKGVWPENPWEWALQTWNVEDKIIPSWRLAAHLVEIMPDKVLQKNSNSVARWLDKVSKLIDLHEPVFLHLCRRLLALPYEDGLDDVGCEDTVGRAINHPIGIVTQALMKIWFKRKPNDNETLPSDIKPFFTQLCDTQVPQFCHGRVLLAFDLMALFRVDQCWTEEHLLPLFDWRINSSEAKGVWEGFLWAPRLYKPLLVALKPQFLETANHYAELDKCGSQLARFLTYVALERVDGYTTQDFRKAVGFYQ